MRHTLTPAAERAFAEAAAWSTGEFSDALEAPGVLLGLLAESECRAAITLASHGIDVAAVQSQWPGLVRLPTRFPAWDGGAVPSDPPLGGIPVRHIAPEVTASLTNVARWLRARGLPIELGTEQVLLGLTAVDHEVSRWLRQQGLEPDGLEAEVQRVHGYQPKPSTAVGSDPLPLDTAEETGTSETRNADYLVPHTRHPVPGTQYSVPSTPRTIPRPIHGAPGIGDSDSAAPSHQPGATPPQEHLQAMRVIDAAANRAREGLRVVEDYVRFVLDDRFLTSRLKELRHELTAALGRFPANERLAARETLADVGTRVATPAERYREDAASVLAANFTRLQESLRSLEEFAKILDPDASAAIEQLRYRAYTLHRAVETTRSGVERLQHARLYVLIDGRSTPEEFSELVRSLVCGGAHVIQLRDKRLDDCALLQRARTLREIASAGNVVFVMNDRPDLAVLSRADGVHIGQEEISVKDARTIVGLAAIIGVSTHSIEQARQAVLDGASYIGVGPTFPSETKQFDRFPGVELLRAVAAEVRLPAFAIGGINLDNLPLVLATGLRRVAIGAAITGVTAPESAARAFLAALA